MALLLKNKYWPLSLNQIIGKMTKNTTEQKINSLQCCVIIPTFNNHKTLQKVIEGVLLYTKNIIIVNDGSTDSTFEILKKYSQIQQLHLPKNKGKGNALRHGFKHAFNLGYHYAITIDSDGQHFPKDIAIFINELEKAENKNLILIGARNMNLESVPKKSSFGNKFSNFWFWAETGIKLQDTQSGFRLYPIHHLKDLKFYTSKFEFEIEVIVKAAWHGVIVKNIPVNILYDEAVRVSHFRPFKDFTRITILNIWLVILTILYIKPRDLFRKLQKKGVKRFIVEDFIGSNDSARKKALSIALGVFIGLTPLWGLHTIIVIFLAVVLNLNKTIAFVFSNISLPYFIPFILFASVQMGNYILGQNLSYNISDITENFEVLKHLKTYIVGSFSLAAITSLILGLLSYFLFSFFQNKKGSITNA
jgi:glycosyltransferase involved in cell wall biosynthesis